MKVTKTSPISYCYGVTKAILKAKKIKKDYPKNNIYFLGDLVHNQKVIDDFKKMNINIIHFNKENIYQKLDTLNKDDIVIFSAHGHDKKYDEYLDKLGILYFDTTCDKVKNILNIIKESDREIIYIGKKGHPECEASLSYSNHIHLYDINSTFDYANLKSDNPLVINQSTLSVLELQDIFLDIKHHVKNPLFYDEICDASRVRQELILNIDKDIDLVCVIGDKNSSNSTKLYELSKLKNKCRTIMVNSLSEIKELELKGYKNALLTSGTSTPLETILEIEKYLKEL